MQLIYDLYKFTKKKSFQKLKGGWRVNLFLEKLVRDRYFSFPYFEGKIWACPTHSSGIALQREGVYEPEIIGIIRNLVENGFSFVDIGANIGLHTVAAGLVSKNKNQRIFAFEPEKGMFSILKRNCATNKLKNVFIYNEAVGNENTILTLNISTTKNKGINSFFASDLVVPGDKVRVSRIDTIFKDNLDHGQEPLPNLDFVIKIDTEGYEFPVISGGLNWFKELSNVAIIFEVSPEFLTKYGKKPVDIIDLLKKVGFTNHYIIKNTETFSETGKLRNNFFNLISVKGEKVNEVLLESEVAKEKFVDFSKIINQIK